MYCRRILLLSLLNFLFCFTYGQQSFHNRPIQFFSLGIEQGLSNNDVNCMYQSQTGNMWIGTFDGLNQYDAYGFSVYRKEISKSYSLPNNRIQSISEDAEGNLLISTMDAVVGMHPVLRNVYPIEYINQSSQKIGPLLGTASFQLSKSTSFIGSAEKGLLKKEKGEIHYRQIPLREDGKLVYDFAVAAMNTDPTGGVWLLIRKKGLAYFDPQSERLMLKNREITEGNFLLIDRQRRMYVATNNGVYSKPIDSKQFDFELFPKPVLHLLLAKDQTIWCATDGEGVYTKGADESEFRKTLVVNGQAGLSSNAVKQVLQDRDGRYWCATLRGGITVIDQQVSAFHTIFPQKLNSRLADHCFVSALADAGHDKIWVGTDGYGLFLWDRSSARFSPVAEYKLADRSVTKILRDRKNNIWVSTWNDGIYRLDGEGELSGHFRCYDPYSKAYADDVWSLFEDASGTIWASTFGLSGLYRWDEEQRQFVMAANNLGNILCFNQDHLGNIWLGTDAQLICFDPKSAVSRRYRLGYRIRSIYFDEKDKLIYLGTEGGGLVEMNISTGNFIAYGEKQGLSNNNVLHILSDQAGGLWMSTFNGLTKFDRKTKHSQKFTVEDGLQSNQFSYQAALKLKTGVLLFGGIRGLSFLYPQQVSFPNANFAPQLSQIRVNDILLKDLFDEGDKMAFSQSNVLDLPIDQNIQVEFSAFPFFAISNIAYEARLVGYDKDWVKLGEMPRVNYNKLPPGSYYLMVRAMAKNGTWKASRLMAIHIKPPWFLSFWAYCSYTMVVVLTVYGYVAIRKRRTRLVYEAKIVQLELEKEKEIAKKRTESFGEIIREIKIPLTLILNPLKALLKSADGMKSSGLDIAYRNANKLYVLADQLSIVGQESDPLRNLELEKFDLHKVIDEEIESFKNAVTDVDFLLEWNDEETEIMLIADRKKIALVLFKLFLLLVEEHHGSSKIYTYIERVGQEIILTMYQSDEGMCLETHRAQTPLKEEEEIHYSERLGLGFQLAKEFVKKHQGQLFVRLGPDRRIGFEVHLLLDDWFNSYYEERSKPLTDRLTRESKTVLEDHFSEEYSEERELRPLQISNKPSVLVVDDNRSFRNYLSKLFADTYHFVELDDTASVRTILEREDVSLILSEVFPDGSGYELCQFLKSDAKYKHIPVVLMSALGTADNQIRGIECGADVFVAKPFDEELFLRQVQALADGRSALKENFLDEITQQNFYEGISVDEKAFLEYCMTVIEQNLLNPDFTAQSLAVACNMSYSNLYKKIRQLTGLAISAFVRSVRLRKAADLLLHTDMNINQICVEIGIQDIKYFRQKFKELYGMSPSAYMKKYKRYFNLTYRIK